MATADSVKTKIQNLITKSNTKTGASDADLTSAVDRLVDGYGQGGGGITPSGTKTIAENGTFDVTSFANALVNIQGINARIFTSTVSTDATSGTPQIAPANDYIASLIAKDNAFVCVRYLGVKASTAMLTFWFNAKFPIVYGGGTQYNAISARQSASACNVTTNVNGITGANYSGHLCVASNGRLYCYPNATYPLRAGTYQIIAGTIEML